MTRKTVFEASQRLYERSANFMGITVAAIGVLVALITILIVVGSIFGALEISKWRNIRKSVEKEAENITCSRSYVDKKVTSIDAIERDLLTKHGELDDLIVGMKKSIDRAEQERIEFASKLTELTGKIIFDPILEEGADYRNYAIMLSHADKNSEALIQIQKALDLSPDEKGSLIAEGNIYHKLGEFKKSLESYEKALVNDPNYYEGWYGKGLALDWLNKKPEALNAFNKAIEIRPDDYAAYEGKANVLLELDRYEDALKNYNMALYRNPLSDTGLYGRSRAYINLGRKDKALNDLSKAIRISEKFKKMANEENDFISIQNDTDFRSLVE